MNTNRTVLSALLEHEFICPDALHLNKLTDLNREGTIIIVISMERPTLFRLM